MKVLVEDVSVLVQAVKMLIETVRVLTKAARMLVEAGQVQVQTMKVLERPWSAFKSRQLASEGCQIWANLVYSA
jgi:hypothetical protein